MTASNNKRADGETPERERSDCERPERECPGRGGPETEGAIVVRGVCSLCRRLGLSEVSLHVVHDPPRHYWHRFVISVADAVPCETLVELAEL